ncbi:hypothetical protein ACFV3R_02245 [Streptomyces sp. NPDC059740]|uniref:hypothetical protein n=1 Tax=Streptomyces sp. NPDC059740 TaxID=3346926 RepID=UPI00364DEB1B
MTLHHHAYTWLGDGQTLIRPGDAHRRPGSPDFRSAAVMPLECADWLLKPAGVVKGTFQEPKEAAGWWADRLAEHRGAFTGTYAPVADPGEVVRRLLAGEDVVGGWWVSGQRFLSLNLIACPHQRRPDYACPLR